MVVEEEEENQKQEKRKKEEEKEKRKIEEKTGIPKNRIDDLCQSPLTCRDNIVQK